MSHPRRSNRSRLSAATRIFLLLFGPAFAVWAAGPLSAEPASRLDPESPARPHVSFELDVQPILAAYGCNSGGCHGKQRGQNGFQLSLLGFDSDFDFAAVTREARGRRIFPAAADQSLLLRKAIAELPHGGGKRFERDSTAYRTLLRWIAEGAPRQIPGEPALERVELQRSKFSLVPGESAGLAVRAHYSDGSSRDVTSLTTYLSNDAAVVSVDPAGVMTAGELAGETAVMARYMNEIRVADVVIPRQQAVPADVFAELPRNNFIDELVYDKLEELAIRPSPPAPDHVFLRRAYTDIIGRLPSVDEAREFLRDEDEGKRERLVDALLRRPEYADHWANQWADLLRPNPYRVGIKAVLNYDDWIRDQFRRNVPYDQFVESLVTAQGSTWQNGAATLYRDRRSPDEMATLVSQLFLGVRLECAKCHHHPFERWSQRDFYEFAAHFARVGHKGTGLSPPISGSEEKIVVADRGEVRHPVTGETLEPRPLFELGDVSPRDETKDAGATPHADPTGDAEATASTDPTASTDVADLARFAPSARDPRRQLAAWMTSRDNPYFAQVQVNRVWATMMGRGLVEPVDDLRSTNPATMPALLEALADHFREVDYDHRELIRVIATSQVYALSSAANESNVADRLNYSRHYRERMRAEVLLDALADVTETPHSLAAMPDGSRANQVWTHRIGSMFLDTFGRPNENQDPPCERTPDASVTQSLHLMNSRDVDGRIRSDRGRAARLAKSEHSAEEIVEELYLATFSRYPDAEEASYAEEWVAAAEDRRAAIEDLMWALLNAPEFTIQN